VLPLLREKLFIRLALLRGAGLVLGGSSMGIVGALAVGLALGAEVDLIGYLTSRYDDTRLYGRLLGVFYSVFTLGAGFSPLLIAMVREGSGGYTTPLIVSVVLLLVAAACSTLTPPGATVRRATLLMTGTAGGSSCEAGRADPLRTVAHLAG
jgi:hypothetical protein